MAEIQIGKTGVRTEQNGFGALPIQRVSRAEAVALLRRAYDGGITYFDTARGYSDSEEKVGAAFAGMRDKVILATKTMARTVDEFWQHLYASLRMLQTDYIDFYQFHMPPFCPRPGGEDGLYDAMLEAKRQGKIRFISITCHRLDVAREAVASGLYETLMYPFSYLSTPEELALVAACREKGVGFVAMKALCGGLLTNAAAAAAWIGQFENVIPIWGVQRAWELEEFLSYIQNPPRLDVHLNACIEADRAALLGDFCRGCGYCMPCPQGIQISTCARASQLVRRAPSNMILSEQGQAMMRQVEHCTGCGACAAKCPYGLDTPSLLKKNYQDIQEILGGKPL